jgi:hypothetical protein
VSEIGSGGEDEPAGGGEGCMASRVARWVEANVGSPEREKGMVAWISNH